MTFVGRLGTYRYYNMDQVVGQALALFDRIAKPRRPTPSARRRGMTRMNGTVHAEAAQGVGD